MKSKLSLSGMFTVMVSLFVLLTSVVTILIFSQIYRKAMELNAVTSSEQAVTQVQNMISSYLKDMEGVMDKIQESAGKHDWDKQEFIPNLIQVREDVVAVTVYDAEGSLLHCWSGDKPLKEHYYQNLSYDKITNDKYSLHISKPHVVSIFSGYYPWVVTISTMMEDVSGKEVQVSMDIRFSNIANYVDTVGIGQRGYCYIADTGGNIVYHPRQQLINLGLQEESNVAMADGQKTNSSVIYTSYTLRDSSWRVVGVSYVDELITSKVRIMIEILIFILLGVFTVTLFSGWLISNMFAKPAKQLTLAMRSFENETENFTYEQINGTEEITTLSKSFDHMVIKIQELMERIRKEEISLRKTELKALQAQINPHFLYNTLDAIAWLCTGKRNEDAEEMVTALARLFRISISKGHEVIPIENELQHAKSYLKIEKFRYKNQFTYHFDVDEECLPYLCNKITLQPIIENAIYHGLSRMVDEGEITIRIYQQKGDILFSVSDNGVGMTEQECREILRKEPGDQTGIGIKNVNDRIKIYFGDQYGLTITSVLDEGTTVTIRMPKVTHWDQLDAT